MKGSSPRMRGAHRVAKIARIRSGIIPAYAGSTSGDMYESDTG